MLGLFNNFTETIILKEDSDMEIKLQALDILKQKYPNNKELEQEYYMLDKGLKGEEQILYQLKKANIGMYVLHDVKLKYEDLTAQIDFVVFTPWACYFIECKNLVGNITVTNTGEFRRDYSYYGNKVKKAISSPITQVENQLEVYRKIWQSRKNNFELLLMKNNFDRDYKTLVVVSNDNGILNVDRAPKDIKYRVVRVDNLKRRLQQDSNRVNKNEWLTEKELKNWAQSFYEKTIKISENYIEKYKEKFNLIEEELKKDLREILISYRTKMVKKTNYPTNYIFTDKELENLIEEKPIDINELKKKKILPYIKIKLYGNDIVNLIKENK